MAATFNASQLPTSSISGVTTTRPAIAGAGGSAPSGDVGAAGAVAPLLERLHALEQAPGPLDLWPSLNPADIAPLGDLLAVEDLHAQDPLPEL